MIDPAAILGHDFGHPEQTYSARDVILYAIGLGLGEDPCDPATLRFLDERSLAVLPSFAVTLCSPGMWIRAPEFGVDFAKLVHIQQSAEFFGTLPAAGKVKGVAKVLSLTDRGAGRGALLVLERTLAGADSDEPYCRLRQTLLLRGNGGFGGEPSPREPAFAPDRKADIETRFATSRRAALIYRLSGDWNPLHLDPAVAAAAGFSRPILHGLASYGIAGVAVSRAMGRDPASLAKLSCRFSGVVVPGDEITFRIWHNDDQGTRFTAFVDDRKVLDNGEIDWKTA
jgi:acyl dehydratase